MKHTAQTPETQGFTLIELSIVLVIIGLIVGGVLVGQDLVKAAELRSIITQKNEFQTAVNAFRLKYNGIPGDIKNATTFWNSLSSCPTERNTYGTTHTCNGTGNKEVAATGVAQEFGEQFRFWQHLSNAGLVAGQYTGRCSSCNSSTVGEDIPVAGVGENNGWMAGSSNYWTNASVLNDVSGSARGMLYLGLASNTFPNSNLSVMDIYQIDAKVDDADPINGQVVAGQNAVWYASCWQINSGVATYLLSSDSRSCPLIFLNAF